MSGYLEKFLQEDKDRFENYVEDTSAAAAHSPSAKINFQDLSYEQQKKISAAVNTLKNKWLRLRSKDTFFSINPHSPLLTKPVRALLNDHETVKKNINRKKQTQLLDALKKGDWNDLIFKDETLMQLAMALYAANKISRIQFETLITWYQASRNLHELRPYPLLNEEGEWTKEAKAFLIPALPGFLHISHWDSERLEYVKSLCREFIACIPSENLFYIRQHIFDPQKDRVSLSLKNVKATLYSINSNEKISLSYSAKEVFKIAAYGEKNLIPCVTILGDLTPYFKKKAVMHNFHPRAAIFPGVPHATSIHDASFSPQSAGDHDDYHAQHMSHQGYVIRKACLRAIKNIQCMLEEAPDLKDKSRDELLSYIMWLFIDADFGYFNNPDKMPYTAPKESAYHFCMALDKDQEDEEKDGKKTFYYLNQDREPTDIGIVCFIDMAKNLSYWKNEIGLDPEFLSPPYKKYYDKAECLKPYFKDNLILNILIYRTFLISEDFNFSIIVKMLEKYYEEEKEDLIIKRNNEKSFLGVVNKKTKNLPLEEVIKSIFLRMLGVDCSDKQINFADHKFELQLLILLNTSLMRFPATRCMKELIIAHLNRKFTMPHGYKPMILIALLTNKLNTVCEKELINDDEKKQLDVIGNLLTDYAKNAPKIKFFPPHNSPAHFYQERFSPSPTSRE